MKRLVIFLLMLACVSGLSGCSGKEDIMDIAGITGLITEKGYTEADVQEELRGKSREDMIDAWGEPDGMLSGLWGELWHLSDYSNKEIILYYDEDGIIEDIKIADRTV